MSEPIALRTYEAPYYCQNCHASHNYKFPFGTIAAAKDMRCKNCGVSKKEIMDFIAEEHKNHMGGQLAKPL